MLESFKISYSSKHKHCILNTSVHGHPRKVSNLPAIAIRLRCLSTNEVFFPVVPQPNSVLGYTTHTRARTHAHPVGLPWTRDQPVAEAATYTRPNKHMKRKSVTSEGFEPTIPAIQGLQTYALDSTATEISQSEVHRS